MFGPPSSPPPALSDSQQAELRSVLLPAFGNDACSTRLPPSASTFKPRQFVKPKFTLYRDEQDDASRETKAVNFLPTPLPTSEANMQEPYSSPSSPQTDCLQENNVVVEKQSHETRAALQQLLIVRIPLSGSPVTVGRSSKSSNFAVKPSNRLASRVHVKLSFDATKNLLMVECLGWNGLTVLVPQEAANGGGKKNYDVKRGQMLNVEKVEGIIIDIFGDRALVEFINDCQTSELTEDESWFQVDTNNADTLSNNSSPSRILHNNDLEEDKENHQRSSLRSPTTSGDFLQSERQVNTSPMSNKLRSKLPNGHDNEQEQNKQEHVKQQHVASPQKQSHKREVAEDIKNELYTQNVESQQLSGSRASSIEPLGGESGPRKIRRTFEPISEESKHQLANVIANYVAFSRMSAVPFAAVRKTNSTLQSLPKAQVRELIRSISCIGVIEGGVEDTTGRKADDEYYYIQERDDNEERRQAVQSSKGHRSLRNCRKTPKQYFYRPLQLD